LNKNTPQKNDYQ